MHGDRGKEKNLIIQKWEGNNVTMLSGHKVVCNSHFTIFIVAIPSRHWHWGLTIFRFFSGTWLVPGAVLRCRGVVVAKLKKLSRAQLWKRTKDVIQPQGPVYYFVVSFRLQLAYAEPGQPVLGRQVRDSFSLSPIFIRLFWKERSAYTL